MPLFLFKVFCEYFIHWCPCVCINLFTFICLFFYVSLYHGFSFLCYKKHYLELQDYHGIIAKKSEENARLQLRLRAIDQRIRLLITHRFAIQVRTLFLETRFVIL